MKLLIASLPIGTGHDIAAQAMAEAAYLDGWQVEFSHHLVAAARVETALYFFGLHYFGTSYGRLFRWSDRTTFNWRQHRMHWRQIGRRILPDVFDEYRPDVVIATHPFALNAWGAVRETHPNLRVVGVLTDLSVHRFWYEPMADAYTVWLPEQVEDLNRFGVASDHVFMTGIPIRASFQETVPPLPIYDRGPIILLGGGLGMGPYTRILRQLATLDWPVVAVCGHNEKLRWKLSEYRWPETVTIAGYVENMPIFLRHAQLVVGKPGGVTAAEVAQSHVPWIVTHWIPGQEEINRDRLLQHHLAVRGDTELTDKVRNLLKNDAPMRQLMLASQEKWARPLAAQDIIRHLKTLC
ncbi:MAG: galactosyldiacylglycerol synthase [Sulfobacillus benefaciens]|uniref:Galactosyldiacylglycerol synthase n=1 Tax=Sulfobacillus benefaciens TaxID=453960 RepID=A0A2T2XL56_9FIRM|nr:MAG: galactosyldiacylglycerol synthase [Sulfobacillus benefaciens]